MKKTFFLALLLVFLMPFQVFAHLQISAILPRPDASADEFIEIINTSCEDIDLGEYSIVVRSKSKKLEEGILKSGETIKLLKEKYKFALVDTGGVIALQKASSGETVDEIAYQKEEVEKGKILSFHFETKDCVSGEDDSHNSSEGSSSSFSGASDNASASGTIQPSVNSSHSGSGTHEQIVTTDELEYLDANDDGFVDTIKVTYSEALTGSVDTSKIFLSSASGGLYDSTISLSTDKILSGSVEANVLTLSIEPTTKKHANLVIDNSRDSHLMLFSNEDFGIVGISGLKVEPFTQFSFGNYTRIIHPNFDNTSDGDNNSGSGTILPQPPASSLGSIQQEFPIIKPVLQHSTDAILLDNNHLSCDRKPCKINLNFDHLFTKDFPSKDFSCKTIFADEEALGCNPPQKTFSSEGDFTFIIERKSDKKSIFAIFSVDFARVSQNSPQNSSPSSVKKPSKKDKDSSLPPVISIFSEGKTDDEYEWISDEKIECFYSPCVINLSASGSYSPDKKSLKYIWKIDNTTEFHKKNPPKFELQTGEHSIVLWVIDSLGTYSEKIIRVSVPSEVREEKPQRSSKNQKKTGIKDKKDEEEGKSEENEEFETPQLVLQNPSKFTREDNVFTCVTSTNTCSVNFSLDKTIKGYKYHWLWQDGESFESINPRAKSLSLGTHTLELWAVSSQNPEEIIWKDRVVVRVTKKSISKKSTKIKKKKLSAKKSSKKTSSKKQHTAIEDNEEEENIPLKKEEILLMESEDTTWHNAQLSLVGILLIGTLFARLRRDRYKKEQ